MNPGMATLQIELEDVSGPSWWVGLLTSVVSPSGKVYMRFVGRVSGQRRRYRGSTFLAPRARDTLATQEKWVPGMARSLNGLLQDLARDGWVEVGRGAKPWALRFERASHPTAGD